MSQPPKPPTAAAREQRAARKRAKRGRARARAAFLAARAGDYDRRALNAAVAEVMDRSPSRAARAFPTSDRQRWVPIGPSVVRRGQATGNPRVTGRIRDLAVDASGTRAYAASAKGGVWYTDDAGGTWSPVGGWAERSGARGGTNNAQACGCLLVAFGASAADDYVLVGTGELVPWVSAFTSVHGGVGVLAGRAPATLAVGGQPWEAEAGLAQLEGLGVFRMARHPASRAGSASGADADRVIAVTSAGLFLGTRSAVVGPPPHDAWAWAKLAGVDALAGVPAPDPIVCDVLWLNNATANGRVVIALQNLGVAFSDDVGANWTWVTALDPTAAPPPGIVGRMSFAHPTGARVYVLGEIVDAAGNNVPTLWQVANMASAAPAAISVGGLPNDLWPAQRDYDQALAVDADGAVDHVYVGGSTVMPTAAANAEWSASLWCFDLPQPVAAGATLVAAPGISTTGAPTAASPTNAGADRPGLIGNNVHADVHAIRLAGPAGANRQVWVGCDGGVFMSARRGRCNTFASRQVGLAVLEVGFHASHPTSSHFVAIGCQDAGGQARQGDTVWEMITAGDGGGTAFHPIASQYIISQWTQATWRSRPRGGYIDPVARSGGGDAGPAPTDRENGASEFYSGCATVQLSPAQGRLAIGTNRVWICDDLDGVGSNTWRTIGFPDGAAREARPGGTDPAPRHGWGVPVTAAGGAIGGVITLRWAGARDLLALYASGLVRYTQDPVSGNWAATVLIPDLAGGPNPANTVLTDVYPVPGSSDFYLTSTGDSATPPGDTCWFFEAATRTFHPTGLRHALDAAGPPVVLGPLDPAYAVAVDPANPNDVFVGTVTGVWRSTRAGTAHGAWTPFVNGLPQAAVQDLGFWVDPAAAAGSPRLLRAAIQSRGMWEVNLAADEAHRTYARVHLRDDRRLFPTPLANPRLAPGATPEVVYASPDITVRPAANPAAAPRWQLGGDTIRAANAPRYELWTFQTAFRWLYPSIPADGLWTDQLGDLIAFHRIASAMPAGRSIDRTLWDAVVGGTRLDAAGAVSAAAADPLAVYRPAWQTPAALNAAATEVDLIELVAPVNTTSSVWRVYREPSSVDVLIHHRDTRPLPAGSAFAVLLWRSDSAIAPLLGADATGLQAYVQSLVTAAPGVVPAGWNVVQPAALPAGAAPLHRLSVSLEARLPRAVSIDVDFSVVPNLHRVLLLAFVGSTTDGFAQAPVGAVATVQDLVRAWPYACMRLVRVSTRP